MKCFLLLLCPLFLGCGKSTCNLQGVLTLDGQPVDGAIIMFHPQVTGPVGIGQSDHQGHFVILVEDRPALPAGKYIITVSKPIHRQTELGKPVESSFPTIYADKVNSTLRHHVQPGMEEMQLQLTDPKPKSTKKLPGKK